MGGLSFCIDVIHPANVKPQALSLNGNMLCHCILMERLVCLIFDVFSFLFSNLKLLWTQVSRCVQKASRRVHYTCIGRYEHLIGRYGRIATCYVYNTDCYA